MTKNLIQEAKKIPWERFGKWRTPLLMDAIASEAWAKPHLTSLGYKKAHCHFLMLDGEYYLDKSEYQDIKRFFEKAWQQGGISFLQEFCRFNLVVTNRAFKATEFLMKFNVEKATSRDLITALKKWIAQTEASMHLNTFFIPLDEVLEEVAKHTIAEHLGKLRKRADSSLLLAELTPPKKIAFVIREEDDLLKLASEIAKRKELTRLFLRSSPRLILAFLEQEKPRLLSKLDRHRERYGWLAATDWWGPLFGFDHYISRITDNLGTNPKATLKKRLAERRQRELAIRKKLRWIKASRDLRILLSLIRDLLDIKQWQWDFVSISGYRGRPLLTEIGKRIGATYDEILQLTPYEISLLLQAKQRVSKTKKLVRERLRHHGFIRMGQVKAVLDARAIYRFRELMPKAFLPADGLLRGSAAFPGFAQGKVRIIPTIKEVTQMRNNEILVCPMTNPDYMSAVRKARAIVTDEGGILAHAAIISRELKIPCVVGTKIATQVFKNGDLVEVDAQKGIVKLVKRK